jgi:protein-S-isoprenylcysteine O-methyltransferase Ste14
MADRSVPSLAEHAGVKIPPPLIYVGIFVVGWLLQQLFPIPALPEVLSRAGGALFVGAGVGLCIWSIALFRQAQTSLVPIKSSTALVITGPYRLTRNPMYLGLLLVYMGVALWSQVLWALLLAPGVIIVIQHQVIVREERYLEGTFGAAYLGYRRRVRRWL